MVPFSAFMKLEKVYGLSESLAIIFTLLLKWWWSCVKDIVLVQLLSDSGNANNKKLPRGYDDWAEFLPMK
jgi:hypothetical protein